MKKNLFCFLLVVFSAHFSFAQSKTTAEYDPSKVWVAVPFGAFIGFGLGHVFQDRYRDIGWIYTITDTIGLFTLGVSLGDCSPGDSGCADRKDQRARSGSALYGISHLIQAVDLSLWAHEYYKRTHTSFRLQPRPDGAAVVWTANF